MNLNRTLSITKRIFKQIRHDRRTMGMILITPIVIMTIFGYTFAGEVKNINVKIVDIDNSNLTKGIENNLNKETLNIAYEGNKENSIKEVEDGKIWALIIFPENFQKNIEAKMQYDAYLKFLENINNSQLPNKTAIINFAKLTMFPNATYQSNENISIAIYIDGSNPTIATAVMKEFNSALQKTMKEQYNISSPINITTNFVYGKDAKFIDFFAPGIIGFVVSFMTTLLTIVTFVREKTNSTFQRLISTPIKEEEIILGYTIAFGVISLIQSSILLTAGVVIFQISIKGNVLLALFLIVLLAIGFQSLGTLLSTAAKNEFQAVQFIPLVLVPSILLAGVFWPIEAIPSFLRPISYVIPLTYGIDGLRSVMIRGWGIERILLDVGILILFAVIMFLLSVRVMRRKG